MGNSSVLPCVVLTTVDAPWYVASTSLTSFSGTPLLLRHQYTRSLGTLSYAFYQIHEGKEQILVHFWVLFLQLLHASVVHCPGLNPNCTLLTVISFLSLCSRIFSNIFIPCSNSLMPLKFPHFSGACIWDDLIFLPLFWHLLLFPNCLQYFMHNVHSTLHYVFDKVYRET